MTWLVRNRVLFFFLVLFLISGTTYFLIQIARGYRFDPIDKGLKAHGLLALKSHPDGAKIYVNGVLRGATDTTIALMPGKYQIDIDKSGFNNWSKLLTINQELVTQSDIFLFPLVPNLQSLTYEGITSPIISPDNTKLAYLSTTSAGSIGIWVYEVGGGLIDFNRSPRLIFDGLQSLVGNIVSLDWSSDNKWLIIKNTSDKNGYLVNPNQINTRNEIINRSVDYLKYEKEWQNNSLTQQQIDLNKLPNKIAEVLTTNAADLSFSVDGLKVLYTATASATIPTGLIASPPTASTQNESRQIVPGVFYIYDYKEDKNFALPYQSPKPTQIKTVAKQPTSPVLPSRNNVPRWLPSSNHLYWVEENEGKQGIWVCEYDGSNKTLAFDGDFDPNYVFTSPTMGKMIILSGLTVNLNSKPNLFSLDLLH